MSQLVNDVSECKLKRAKIIELANIIMHEAIWSIQEQVEKTVKMFLKAEQIHVAICSDDFWIGMKG